MTIQNKDESSTQDPKSIGGVLDRCEAFITGFEDDQAQEGVTDLLRDLRVLMSPDVDQCPACHMSPDGPTGEMQCRYCGSLLSPDGRGVARLWDFVAQSFNGSKTSTSKRMLEGLGLPNDDAHRPLAWHINRAFLVAQSGRDG